MPAYTSPEQGRNALHRLLLRIAPTNSQGNISITELGKQIERSRTTMHTYITDQKLDPKTAKALVAYATKEGKTLTLQDMEAFVYNV